MHSPIDEIKSKLDVVEVIQGYIRLSKAGRNYRALCPFHSEKTPSFSVSPERQMWYCFGCQKGGSIFDFVMAIEGIEFGEALKILAQRAGVELKKIDPKLCAKWRTEKTRLYGICELAARFFEKQLEAGKTGLLVQKYLKERGLKPKTIQEWRLCFSPASNASRSDAGWPLKWRSLSDFLGGRGYGEEEIFKTGLSVKKDEIPRPTSSLTKSKAGGQDTKYQIQNTNSYDRFRHRIIFPIFDLNGAVVGFSGRIFGEGEPKYLNTSNTLIYDKSRILYGLDKAKLYIRKENLCVLVEGQMDVLMSHQAGVKNTVACSGTALTEEHLKIIKRYTDNLATAFDMDLAGETATKRSVDLAISFGFDARIIQMPANQDPADCLKNNSSLWPQLIKKAGSIMEFYFSAAFSKFNPALAQGKKEIAKILLPVIKKIPNKIEQAHWVQELGKRFQTDEKILMEEMKKTKDLSRGQSPINSGAAPSSFEKNGGSPRINSNRLEEYLFSLFWSQPELINDFKNQPSYLFVNPELANAFKKIKKLKTINQDALKENISVDLADRINFLVFKKEIEPTENFSPKKEIEFCFAQLKSRFFRQKLTQLNLAIREAERRKDKSALKDLTEEFNKLSRQMVAGN